jgi:hypothetical protein
VSDFETDKESSDDELDEIYENTQEEYLIDELDRVSFKDQQENTPGNTVFTDTFEAGPGSLIAMT